MKYRKDLTAARLREVLDCKAGAISAGFERARGPLHDVRVGTPSAKQLGYHK
jgi:hypothetical protein